MIKGICIPFGYVNNKTLQELILQKFSGLLVRSKEEYVFYLLNRQRLKDSMQDGFNVAQALPAYYDEPSHKWAWIHDKLDKFVGYCPNALIGDLNKSSLEEYYNRYKDIELTYTAYRDVLINFYPLIDLRIFKFWGNQIKTWEWMHKKFGARFSTCWVNIKSNEKDYAKLISWATTYNKDIWFYVQDSVPVGELINQINKLKL